MKKTFKLLCILLSMILTFPLNTHATNESVPEDTTTDHASKYSSSYIEPEVLDALRDEGVDPDAKIVKVYNMAPRFVFYEYSTIEEIMNSKHSEAVFYAIWHLDELRFYSSGRLKSTENTMFSEEALLIYFNDETIKKVSPDIVAYNVYYLSGTTNHQGTALYYETNMGDYIYYVANTHYLMPRADFVEFMRAMTEEIRKLHADVGYGGSSAVDLSKYEKFNLNSPDFDPSVLAGNANVGNQPVNNDPGKTDNTLWIIAISGVSVAVVAAATVLILRKRKTSKTEDSSLS